MLSSLPFEVPASLRDKARRMGAVRMAIANVESPELAASVKAAVAAGVITPILTGDPAQIASAARAADLDLTGITIEPAAGEAAAAAARCVAMVRAGEAAAIMKGDIHTNVLLRAVIDRHTGIRREKRLSHIFRMTVPGDDRALYITDAAINVAPDCEQLVTIAGNAVRLAHALGLSEPRVAFLSASEVVDPGMPSTLLMQQAAEAAQREIAGALCAGPFAFDNAISPRAAALKNIRNAVAGHADIVVVPNIETGNAMFKMMVWFMSACAAGVVVGAACPIVLTSRADPPEARLASAICAALLAKAAPQA